MKPKKEFEGSLDYGFTTGKDKDTYSNLGAIRLGTKQELFYLQLSGQIYDVKGAQASNSAPTKGKIFGSNSKDYKVSFKAAFTPNDTDEYAFIYSKQDGEKQSKIYQGKDKNSINKDKFWKWKDWDKESFYFLSNTDFGALYLKTKAFYDKFQNTLAAYDDKTFTTQKKQYAFTSIYDDYSWGLGLETGGEISSQNTLKFASNFKKDAHKEHNIGDPWQKNEDNSYSFALEDTHAISDNTRVITGISYDVRNNKLAQYYDKGKKQILKHPSKNAQAFNYQALLKHNFDESDELTLSFAKKSRFPTMKDRYSQRFKTHIQNPNLKQEYAYHYDIGYNKMFFDSLNLGANLFYSNTKDAIQSVDNVSGKKAQIQNIGNIKFYGAELSSNYKLNDDLELGANYTYINFDLGKDQKGNKVYLTHIPHHKFFAYLNYEFMPKFSLFVSEEAQSASHSDSEGKFDTKSFGVTNLKLTYEAIKDLNIDAGISNVFDTYYEYNEGYGENGRMFFVNLRYNF